MKKLIFTLAIMLSAVAGVNAQAPGKIWVGGSIGFESSKVKGTDRLNDYNITPEIGYVLTDNWGIGMKFGYVHNEDLVGVNKIKADGFSVKPFARYAFLKGDIGGLFLDMGAGYEHMKVKGGAKTDIYEVGFRPGVALNVSDKVSIIGTFGHLGYQHEKAGDVKTDKFGFNMHLDQIQLGVNFVF